MLKFIRKYQLFILAIGGSLLMVVFLLEPILTRISPSPMKAKVATLEDGTKFTRMDIQNANVAISLLKRVNPRALGPRTVGGMGLDSSSESNTALHWLMLARQAELAGLIGEAGDGASWIGELALSEAVIQAGPEAQNQARMEVQQGLIASEAAFSQRYEALTMQRAAELAPQFEQIMTRNVTLSAANAGGTMDDVYRILAQARGIYRMLSSIQRLPTFSDVNAIKAAHDALDSVAIDAAVINSSLITDSIADPSEAELQTFFDTYKSQSPADNDFNIGYTQPTRIQLGWITLDKNIFMNTVKVDRVELNKIWRQNRDQYIGDFALERPNLERQFREDTATDMLIEADRIIRAQVLSVTNGLPSVNGILTLPDDWDSRRPRLETIANTVVERINEQFSVSMPTPAVNIIGDRWLNANTVSTLEGFGSSSYRIGSRQIPAFGLPAFFELTEPNTTGLDVQVGLPLVDPASEDQVGNRYYAVILGTRVKGPADTIDDVTREQVLADYKSVKAYEMLLQQVEQFQTLIADTGSIAGAIDLAVSMSADSLTANRPGVLRNILVRRDAIERGNLAVFVDPSLNVEAFRDAVIASADSIDPLATPETVAQAPSPIVVPLPGSRSVALGMVIAPRPVTAERFTSMARSIIASTAQRELMDAGMIENDPFSFASLSSKFGLTKIDSDDDESAEDAETEEIASVSD